MTFNAVLQRIRPEDPEQELGEIMILITAAATSVAAAGVTLLARYVRGR